MPTRLLPLPLLLLLCVACTPAVPAPLPPEPMTAEPPASPTPSPAATFATQTQAPAPDYRALLRQPSLSGEGWAERKATMPPPPDAKAVGALWLDRLKERNALLGAGLTGKGSDGPVILLDTGLTESEFDGWVRDNGWTAPRHIRWSFVPALNLPPVSEAAKAGIRVWPASTARTGAQNEALLAGRVELRDGCFYVGEGRAKPDKLAWFHAEVGLDKDAEGFFILRNRVSGQTLTRLGEDMVWGGPASASMDDPAVRALREACGSGEVFVVGSPESRERFMTQHPHLRQPQNPPPPPQRR